MAISIFSGIELGFVFSDETELTDTQSVLYSVAKLPSEPYLELYQFRAIVGDQIQNLQLKRYKNNIYVVNTKELGNYYFQLIEINPVWNNYRGNQKKWDKELKFTFLNCLNFQQLELASRRNILTFIGDVFE